MILQLAIYPIVTSMCNFTKDCHLKKDINPKQMKMDILIFCFYFCLPYSMTITLFDFDHSFLKIILKRTLCGLLQDQVYLLFSIILNQNDHLLPFLTQSLYSSFYALFVDVSYAINLISVSHIVNLALHAVISIRNIHRTKRNIQELGIKKDTVRRYKD